MKIEFRVFQKQKIIFRKQFDLGAKPTLEMIRSISAEMVAAFRLEHPLLRLDDPMLRTEWSSPDSPLPS